MSAKQKLDEVLYYDPPHCPRCDADRVTLLGTLGHLDHFRCRLCGSDFSSSKRG